MTTDVDMGGLIGDTVDAVKRGWDRAKEGVGKEADRLRKRYEEERRERAVRLGLLVLIGYLVLRD